MNKLCHTLKLGSTVIKCKGVFPLITKLFSAHFLFICLSVNALIFFQLLLDFDKDLVSN